MYLKKMYCTKDKNSEWETVLFNSKEEAEKITKLPTDNFESCGVICYNDGDIAWTGDINDIMTQYEKMESVEKDKILGVKRGEEEAYVNDSKLDEIKVIKKNRVIEFFQNN